MQTKKLIKIVLSCCVLVGIPAAIAQTQIFSDVDNSSWYGPYVRAIAEKGIVNGYPDGSYHPAESVNRAELAKIIFNTIDTLEKQNKVLEARIESLESLNGIEVVDIPNTNSNNISVIDTSEIKTGQLQSNIIESVKKIEILSENVTGIKKVEGEVKNTGNQVLENVVIEINYLDSKEALIQSDTTYITPEILQPGELGKFSFTIPNITYYSYQIKAIQ